ncbi:hypothetical protein ACE6H2_006255 [Prunus campanulata]
MKLKDDSQSPSRDLNPKSKLEFKLPVGMAAKICDLLVNITKHALKPKLEILTAEEKNKLLRKYKLEDKQLPQMLETDGIARYYGLEKGKVVKVTYRGGVIGSLKTYRCVV